MWEWTGAAQLRETMRAWRLAGERIALVPTMGNLHAGHLSLIARAREHATRVVCSVFINPTQFAPGEDFERYPRTPEQDRQQLRSAGVDALFVPDAAEVYPFGIAQATQVRVPGLGDILCGANRPGHFDGVATVVLRLLHLVAPDVAIFGEKDFQQLAIVRHLVRDLSVPVAIVAAPTQRAPDGLALSSRNQYLTAEERRRAPALFAALQRLRAAVAAGEANFAALERDALDQLRAAGLRPEYVEIRDALTLARVDEISSASRDTDPGPVAQPGDRPLVALAAAWLGRTRLIDNVRLN